MVIPAHAGVFSALGLLLSPPRVDAARTVMLDRSEARALDRAVEAVRRGALGGLEKASGAGGAVASHVDVRYRGQSHEVPVPYGPGDRWDALADRFHQLHAERNGFARPDDPILIGIRGLDLVGISRDAELCDAGRVPLLNAAVG